MSVRDCRYDGSRKLNIKAAPTGAGDEREHKQELEERTAENIARACQLQEMLMAEGREGLIVAIQAPCLSSVIAPGLRLGICTIP